MNSQGDGEDMAVYGFAPCRSFACPVCLSSAAALALTQVYERYGFGRHYGRNFGRYNGRKVSGKWAVFEVTALQPSQAFLAESRPLGEDIMHFDMKRGRRAPLDVFGISAEIPCGRTLTDTTQNGISLHSPMCPCRPQCLFFVPLRKTTLNANWRTSGSGSSTDGGGGGHAFPPILSHRSPRSRVRPRLKELIFPFRIMLSSPISCYTRDI